MRGGTPRDPPGNPQPTPETPNCPRPPWDPPGTHGSGSWLCCRPRESRWGRLAPRFDVTSGATGKSRPLPAACAPPPLPRWPPRAEPATPKMADGSHSREPRATPKMAASPLQCHSQDGGRTIGDTSAPVKMAGTPATLKMAATPSHGHTQDGGRSPGCPPAASPLKMAPTPRPRLTQDGGTRGDPSPPAPRSTSRTHSRWRPTPARRPQDGAARRKDRKCPGQECRFYSFFQRLPLRFGAGEGAALTVSGGRGGGGAFPPRTPPQPPPPKAAAAAVLFIYL